MRNTNTLRLLAVAATAAFFGCGDDTTEPVDAAVTDTGVDHGADAADAADAAPDTAATATLQITAGSVFATPTLIVAPGAVITVENKDPDSAHTVTSEAALDDFTPNGKFDTGNIPPNGTATFTIPADAQPGTTFFYYCKVHLGSMSPKNGTITVQ